MNLDSPITISGRQVAEWGPMQTDTIKSTLLELMEGRTGQKMHWQQELNRDAITLVPLPPEPVSSPDAIARIEIYSDNIRIDMLPDHQGEIIRQLLVLIDALKNSPRATYVELACVERVPV